MTCAADEALRAWQRADSNRDALNKASLAAIQGGKLDAAGPLVDSIRNLSEVQFSTLAFAVGELQEAMKLGVSRSHGACDIYRTAEQLNAQAFQLGTMLETQTGVGNPVPSPTIGSVVADATSGLGGLLVGAALLLMVFAFVWKKI